MKQLVVSIIFLFLWTGICYSQKEDLIKKYQVDTTKISGKRVGLIRENGEVVFPVIATSIEGVASGRSFFKINGMIGILDSLGNVLHDPVKNIEGYNFGYIEKYRSGITITKDDKWGLADDDFKVVIEPVYDQLLVYRNYCIAEKDGQIAVLDSLGKEIVPFTDKYQNIKPKSRNFDFFTATVRDSSVIVNRSGKIITPLSKSEYLVKGDSINEFYNAQKGYISFYCNGYGAVIDTLGNQIIPLDEKIFFGKFYPRSPNYYLYTRSGKEGVANTDAQVILEPVYDRVRLSSDNKFIFAEKDDLYYCFTIEGKLLKKSQYYYTDESFKLRDLGIAFLEYGKEAAPNYYDKDGNLLQINKESLPYKNLFYKKIGSSPDGKKRGLVNDLTGEIIIPYMYDDFSFPIIMDDTSLDGHYFEAKYKGKFGIVDSLNQVVLPFKYNDLRIVGYNRAFVKIGNNAFLVDWQGNKLSNNYINYSTLSQNNKYFIVLKSREKVGLMNIDGKEIVPCKYPLGANFYPVGSNCIRVRNKDDEWGLFDLNTGKEIFPVEYRGIYQFSNRDEKTPYLEIIKDDEISLYDTQTNKFLFPFGLYSFFSIYKKDEILEVTEEQTSKKGLIDYQGNIILPFIYDDLWTYNKAKGILEVYKTYHAPKGTDTDQSKESSYTNSDSTNKTFRIIHREGVE